MELIMQTNQSNSDKYFAAKQQVEKIKGFYGNLISYLIGNLFLLYINLQYSPNDLWFFWPFLGWGIGVVFHGIRVFNYMPFLGKNWEQKKIEQFMQQDKNQNHAN
jgi:2TM domain